MLCRKEYTWISKNRAFCKPPCPTWFISFAGGMEFGDWVSLVAFVVKMSVNLLIEKF